MLTPESGLFTEVRAVQYFRDPIPGTKREPEITEAFVSELEEDAMRMIIDSAEENLRRGNAPVAAALIYQEGVASWSAVTIDQTTKKITDHAEQILYGRAYPVVGGDLSQTSVMSTARLCSSCTPIYAEGKIGKIITGAPRRFVFQLTGAMRPRESNMHELLRDGDTHTLSIENYQLERSLALFALWGKLRGHEIPDDIDDFLLPFVRDAQKAKKTIAI